MRSRAVVEEPAPTQPDTVTGTGVLTSPLPHSTHPLPQNRYQDPHSTHSPPYQGPPQPIAVPGSSRSSPAVLPPSGTSSPQHPLPTVPGPLPPPVTGPKPLTPSTPTTPLRTPTIRLPQAEQRDQHQQPNFRTEIHGSLPLGSARRLTVPAAATAFYKLRRARPIAARNCGASSVSQQRGSREVVRSRRVCALRQALLSLSVRTAGAARGLSRGLSRLHLTGAGVKGVRWYRALADPRPSAGHVWTRTPLGTGHLAPNPHQKGGKTLLSWKILQPQPPSCLNLGLL